VRFYTPEEFFGVEGKDGVKGVDVDELEGGGGGGEVDVGGGGGLHSSTFQLNLSCF